ncbi:hypothetical protein [Psychroserpens sp. NJDZ02]|uniref:hypothetical protein n=1 Tax=Psychroserpens sp. NJDZ02 TaxID=2570561 RepID=UPI0010A7581E|nr:hypothetical protein [Psychroserpens sp. NJDZ02]QCE42548.1 hypothetical protein E9099_14440 [Psychroserpens sp. NJDZ02]
MKSKIKLIHLVVVCITLWSCKQDDQTTATDTNQSILGEWLRSDFLVDATTQYKLHFYDANNDGLITNQVTSKEGVISSATPFNWSLIHNTLTITKDDSSQIITNVAYLDNGNLYLADFSTLEFIKQ